LYSRVERTCLEEMNELQHLSFTLQPRDLSYVSERGDRIVGSGTYGVSVGGGLPGTLSIPAMPTERKPSCASWAITKQVVEKSDYLIDLHGGDLDESLRPYSYWAPTGNAQQDAVSRAMVLAFGLDTIILSTNRPRDLTPQCWRPSLLASLN